jgi:membrane protease YdiL (CAAX protease family)
MKLGQYWHQCEFLQPKPYSGLGEGFIALVATLIWFTAILVRHQLPGSGDWTLSESLTEAFSFVVFAAVPIFGLATPTGEQFVKQVLLPKQGFGFQCLLCAALAILIAFSKGLNLNPLHFDWISQLNTLIIAGQFWLNSTLFLGGVFVALRIPFVVQALKQQPQAPLRWQLYGLLLLNTLYLSLHRTAIPWEGFVVSGVYGLVCLGLIWPSQTITVSPLQRLVPSDFGLMVLCIAILYWFSIPSFSFGGFIGVDLFILVMVYGSGLGRSHFGYSFATRPKDWPVLGVIVVVAIATLVPIAIFSGFVQPTQAHNQFNPLRLAVYFALFTFRVGIFEEVFFRSGLMVLLRDCLEQRAESGAKRSPQTILLLSVLGCSVLFGLSHIGNASSTNPLTLWQYRGLYIALATSASMFYALAFAKTNRLAVPILVHGVVDTVAVVLLGGSLAVPF